MNTNDARIVADWLEWLESGNLSPNTIRNRRYTIAPFVATHELATTTTGDIITYLSELKGGPWSKAGHLAAIRSLYHYAHGTGQVPANPAAMVRPVRTHDRTRPRLPKVVLDRALMLADDRTRFALLLGSRAGLRREEIATFHTDCVRGDSLVIVGKGSKERTIPMHPRLRPYCDDLTEQPGWAFPSHVLPGRHVGPETIQRRVTRALGDPWRTHDLRRYAATSWYEATHDLRTVQELLGHADPATTAHYVHVGDDARRAAVLAVA